MVLLTGWKGESPEWNLILYLGSLVLRAAVTPNAKNSRSSKLKTGKLMSNSITHSFH